MKRGLMTVLKLAVLGALAGGALPTTASAWWSQDWQHRRKVTLDARAVQGLKQTVSRVPVLLRLHGGTVNFTQFKPDGSDLRFVAADDKTPLNFHIERFDPAAEIALVWIDVPELAAGQPRDIWMYYGSATGSTRSDPAATYDGEQSLVLHLSEGTGTPVDRTANRNPVTATGAAPVVDGVIAGALALKPDSRIVAAPSQSLRIDAAGQMTWSAWVKINAEGSPADAPIYTKLSAGGAAAPDRLTVGLRGGMPFVQLAGAASGEAVARTAVTPGTWAHLAVTAGDGQVMLYVNGSEAARFAAALPELAGPDVIGAIGTTPGIAGVVDEIGRANTARSASFLAVQAQSQGPLSRFATVSPKAEDQGTASVGYVRILVGALTPDAWFVILLLTGMAAASWVIMASKAQLVSRTVAANAKFLGAFREVMGKPDRARALAEAPVGRDAPASTLAQMFNAAQGELRQRLAEGDGVTLAPQAVAMVRALLDAARIGEEKRLSRRMVLLTIAISGGPFLGLLGTVVGVMITFAGVAAAGEVNITAIAPGIAAALLATVAGLVVAIPALFGYNYLNSRLDDIGDDHEIFVEELEKRIADTFRPTGR